MRGKYILLIACVSFCAISLSGCGKSEKDKAADFYENELGFSEDEADELADAIWGDGKTEETVSAEETVLAGETVEDVPEKYETFEALSDWSNYTIADRAVQVDDVIYVPGVSAADFMAAVESSSIDYTYEYNAGKLVTGKDIEKITIYRDGEAWINTSVVNIFDETTALSELPVLRVEVCPAALNYAYFLDGISYNDILAMNYTDLKNYAESRFPEYTFKESSTKVNNIECISLQYNGMPDAVLKRTEWTGCSITANMFYTFYIDKNTSQVIKFSMDPSMGLTWKKNQ